MSIFEYSNPKPIIGMVHIAALPGSPRQQLSVAQITDLALRDLAIYQEAGLDSIMLENMNDIPYLNRRAPEETLAAIAIIAARLRSETKLPIGLQILAGANKAALAIAHCAELDYIRAEGFVFGHLADEGYMDSDAGELLRYRHHLGAERIKIFTDIKKKHSSHALTSDVSLAETAKAAEFFLSDGLIVTGSSTGEPCSPADLICVRKASGLPLLVGSGITMDNLAEFWPLADAFIVGSHFKEDGLWSRPISTSRVQSFMQQVNNLRQSSGEST